MKKKTNINEFSIIKGSTKLQHFNFDNYDEKIYLDKPMSLQPGKALKENT